MLVYQRVSFLFQLDTFDDTAGYISWILSHGSREIHEQIRKFNPVNIIVPIKSYYPLVNVYINYRKSPCLMGNPTINGHFQVNSSEFY